MAKKETKLQELQKEAEEIAEKTNLKIEKLGEKTGVLAEKLNEIQIIFDNIRGWSEKEQLTLEKLKKERLNWIQQVEKIESDYKSAEMKTAGSGMAGAGAGIAVAALGPTAAMGIATTFGVASTGTAISTLSGAAATNAALAWLGGGALAVGGGGMAAGNFLLVLAGPVGWSIAGASIIGSSAIFIKGKNDRKKLEKVYELISTRDIKSYQLAIVELNERINRINEESGILSKAILEVSSFGNQYDKMSEEQQYRLITLVNLMNSSTQLLINPILGLQPKYNEKDLNDYLEEYDILMNKKKRNLYLVLANLFFEIKLDDTDKKLLWKSFKNNKEFLENMDISKKELELEDLYNVYSALDYKKRISK